MDDSVRNSSPMKQPSGLLPIIMSVVALAIVVGHYAAYGIVHEVDEGTPAHLFQLLMVIQLPIIGYFALTWLPRAPSQALRVLALQAAAMIVAFASVYWLTG